MAQEVSNHDMSLSGTLRSVLRAVRRSRRKENTSTMLTPLPSIVEATVVESVVFMYLGFNLLLNIFAVLVIKHGSAALSFLVSTLRMPLSALAFSSTMIMGAEAAAFRLHDFMGLVTILLGLASYRLGSRQLKRQLKPGTPVTLAFIGVGRFVKHLKMGDFQDLC
eukprot:s1891_g17.t1